MFKKSRWERFIFINFTSRYIKCYASNIEIEFLGKTTISFEHFMEHHNTEAMIRKYDKISDFHGLFAVIESEFSKFNAYSMDYYKFLLDGRR